MRWPSYRPSKRAVFGLLMLTSGLSLSVVPKEWSDRVKDVGQPMVWLEDWLYRGAHAAAAGVSNVDSPGATEQVERQALLNLLGSQILLSDQLRDENARLRAIRENELPGDVPLLLPAKVVARDIVEWRDSVLIERGSYRGVRRKDWVASRFFVDHGRVQGVEEGQAVLAQECLLGRVEQVSLYMAAVQLLSDLESPPIEVRVGSLRKTEFEFVDYPCSLRGLGRGRMVIEDVPYKYVYGAPDPEQGDFRRRLQVGDLVFSAPGQLGLPRPLVIGKVVELKEDLKKRLVVSLIVEPVVTMDQVRDVFVVPLIPPERTPIRE